MDNEFFQKFKQLPSELQKLILTYSPEYYKEFFPVISEYEKLPDTDYVCNQPVSLSENLCFSSDWITYGICHILSKYTSDIYWQYLYIGIHQ